MHLADLISADLLPAGTTLLPAQSGTDAVATVLPDGKIAYASEIYNTPSAASGAASGHRPTGGHSGPQTHPTDDSPSQRSATNSWPAVSSRTTQAALSGAGYRFMIRIRRSARFCGPCCRLRLHV